jgi:DNA-binding MarR family transcriptional regulator
MTVNVAAGCSMWGRWPAFDRRPGRGRRIEHRLTPAEETMLAAGHPVASSVLGASFASLSEDERTILLDLLLRIARDDLA